MAENRFGAVSAEEEDEAPTTPRFGAISAEEEPEAPAPLQAAQTSINQAFNAPAAGPGFLSQVAQAGIQGLADVGSGVVSGVPFGLGPSIVGLLPGTSTEEAEQDIAAAKKRSPVLFGVGEFGAELPAFLTGAGAGEKLAAKAAPAAARYLSPGLRKAGAYLLKGVGLGGVTGTEAAGRALVEGKPVDEALATGAKTGLSMAALPATFAAAPAAVGAIPGAGRVAKSLASIVAPTALAVESAPFEGDPTGLTSNRFENKGDATDWTKWLLTQGTMAGGAMGLEGGLGEAFERLASTSKESIQPKLRRATSEGVEMARGDVYGQEARRLLQERAMETPVEKMKREQAVRTQAEGEIGAYRRNEAERLQSIQEEAASRQEAKRQANFDRQIVEATRKGDFKLRDAETKKRNQQFRTALREEGRVLRTAAETETKATATLERLQREAESLAVLERGIEDGSDPSLRGMLGKLFQDTNNRIKGAEETVARNPGRYDAAFLEKLKATRDVIDDSYIRNTTRGGYLADFVDDPYVRLEAFRQDRLAQVGRDRNANAAEQARASEQLLLDFVQEARAQLQPVPIPEERIQQIAEQAGLAYERREGVALGQIDPPFGTKEVYQLRTSPASAVAPESRVVELERKRAERPVSKAEMVEIVRREREARGETAPPKPTRAKARLDEMRFEEAEARLGTATGETPLQTVIRRLRALPENDSRKAALESRVQAEFERQVAAGGRTLQGLAPEAEYGEKPEFMNVMDVSRARAATQPLLPDWVQPNVALRAIAGPVRAIAQAPESRFKETQGIREERKPTETTMEKPYNAVAMLRAWDKVLERPSDATRSVIARIADRMGITPDKLIRTTAYRAAALEQALKEPKVKEEVLSAISSAP